MTSIADLLLQSGTLKIQAEQPFRLVSGLLSPFYIDCRLIIGMPEIRHAIADALADKAANDVGEDQFDIVAGGVTAGVPFATMIAERLNKPLVYIRPEPKAHGKGGQIEGGDVTGKRVLLVEDLVARASSVQKFHAALQTANASVDHLLVIVSRADEAARANLKSLNLSLHFLVDINTIVSSLDQNPETQDKARIIQEFLVDPDGWSQKKL